LRPNSVFLLVGDAIVNSDLSGSGADQLYNGALTARFYNVIGAGNLDPALGATIGLKAYAGRHRPISTHRFGAGTETLPGDGSVIDRGGSSGNLLGGLGVDIGVDNISRLWTGSIIIPQTADGVFTVRKDDGARVWLDTSNDGIFEVVTERTTGGGVSNTSGAPVSLAAGVYPFKAAWYEGGGGAGMQVSWAQTTGVNPFARRNIEPRAFQTLVSANNSVIKNGIGTLTLAGNNSYNGETAINQGLLIAASDQALGAVPAGTFSDPCSGDVVTITASVGHVTQTGTNSGTWNWSLLTTDGDAGDVLHGERGDDWYLLFANDRLRISSEAKAPNVIRRY
jgi:autotransporter-associated beta strand protein